MKKTTEQKNEATSVETSHEKRVLKACQKLYETQGGTSKGENICVLVSWAQDTDVGKRDRRGTISREAQAKQERYLAKCPKQTLSEGVKKKRNI